jgi:hypothetical protein
MMAASTIMSEENHVDKVEKPKLPTSKDFEQKFLDYFYQLADDDGNVRKQASVDIIRSVLSPASTVRIVAYLKFTNCSHNICNLSWHAFNRNLNYCTLLDVWCKDWHPQGNMQDTDSMSHLSHF